MDDATIAILATELPLYLAAADGIMCDSEEEKLVWWAASGHSSTLGCIGQEYSVSTTRGSSRGLHRGICDTIIIKESSRCVISSFSLLVDPDCESVITLLILIKRKQHLARFVNQIVTLTV